ncbi:MAG TPA: DMT family transporter [Methanoculleus sp.]|nr:DMT family transporter [Methanoculleus sp.]
MPRDARVSIVSALAAAVLFGAGAPLSKLLVGGVAPLTLSGLLYLGAGLGMSAYFVLTAWRSNRRRSVEAPLVRTDYPLLALSLVLGSILPTVILMMSLACTPAVTASLLLGFEAVVTTFVASAMFREPVGTRIWGALALITLACMALTYSPGSALGFSLGAFGVLLTCVFWGIEVNINRALSGKDPVRIVVIKGWAAGAIMMAAAVLLGETLPAPHTVMAAMAVGFLSFGGMMVLCYLRALRGLGAARTGAIFGINPLFGVILSFIIFREIPGTAVFLALPLMAGGLFLMLSERHCHIHHHPAEAHEHRHRHDDGHHDHCHAPGDPPRDRQGYHSHLHAHEAVAHEHPHHPDTHHRHRHG